MIGSRLTESAVSVRARCSRMIWEAAILATVLMSSTVGLFGFLTDESIHIQAISVFVLGVIPAAAVLLLTAVVVALLRFLGAIYDLLRAAVAYSFVSCVCLDTAFLARIMKSHEIDLNQVLVRTAVQLIRGTMIGTMWVGRLLRRPAERARTGCMFVAQEIVLEFLWAKQVAARLAAMMPFIATWPLRASARLLLRLIDWSDQTAIFRGEKRPKMPLYGSNVGEPVGVPSCLYAAVPDFTSTRGSSSARNAASAFRNDIKAGSSIGVSGWRTPYSRISASSSHALLIGSTSPGDAATK
jgi:hypothetical protein